jgi:hypothetical protein
VRAGTIIGAAVLAAATSPAEASPKWSSAGWYQIEDIEVDGWIMSGPFWTEESCRATLPGSFYDDEYDYYVTYTCEYLGVQPAWDV